MRPRYAADGCDRSAAVRSGHRDDDRIELGREPALARRRAGGAALDGGGRRNRPPRRRPAGQGDRRRALVHRGGDDRRRAALARPRCRASLDVDRDRGRVRVEAGIRLRALNDELARRRPGACPTSATSTASRSPGRSPRPPTAPGSGSATWRRRSSAMEIVTGTGDVVRLDEHSDPELLRVARVGLGALGIVTEVTLQCVPAFNLHAPETIEVLDDVLDGFAEQAAAVDHFELYWMPGGGKRCQVKRNARTDEPARPQPRARLRPRQVDRREPRLRPGVPGRSALPDRRAAHRQARHVGGRRARPRRPQRPGVLQPAAGPLRRDGVRHPGRAPARRRAPAARLRPRPADTGAVPGRGARLGRRRHPAVDGRSAGRPGGSPCTSTAARRTRSTSPASSGSWTTTAGGPHWGKLHGQRAATLAPRYPQWADFQAARDKLDPDRTFANAYLDRVLG